MKLIYWYAECLDDGDCYSIRTKTKRDCKEIREELGEERYAPPVKVVIEYADGFDLMEQLSDESGNPGEATARGENLKRRDPEYAAFIAAYEASEEGE